MRLPKWVVKWVKDNFDVDALELKCRQQEEKIKRLNKEIAMLKWKALPEYERKWALEAYLILTWKLFWWETDFIVEYIKQQEEWEAIRLPELWNNELPF